MAAICRAEREQGTDKSSAILDEMADVLARKFDFTEEEIAEARQRIISMARTVKPSVQLEVIKEDQADNRILACAVAAGSQFIVTGDKDLSFNDGLRGGRHSGIKPKDTLRRTSDAD